MYLSGHDDVDNGTMGKKTYVLRKKISQSWLQYPAKLDRVNPLSNETTWKPARLWTTNMGIVELLEIVCREQQLGSCDALVAGVQGFSRQTRECVDQ